MSTYDENGAHTGPAKLIWANGAVREGQKVNGKWHGEVFYTYAEGPRKGKRDKETWVSGELRSTKKLYDKVLCCQLLPVVASCCQLLPVVTSCCQLLLVNSTCLSFCLKYHLKYVFDD